MTTLYYDGLRVVASNALPLPPSPGEDARRIVRHGLARVLEWLGEPVGPAPGVATHAVRAGDVLYVSRDLRADLIGMSLTADIEAMLNGPGHPWTIPWGTAQVYTAPPDTPPPPPTGQPLEGWTALGQGDEPAPY